MSSQKVENENREHVEVNKAFTIKCSYIRIQDLREMFCGAMIQRK